MYHMEELNFLFNLKLDITKVAENEMLECLVNAQCNWLTCTQNQFLKLIKLKFEKFEIVEIVGHETWFLAIRIKDIFPNVKELRFNGCQLCIVDGVQVRELLW